MIDSRQETLDRATSAMSGLTLEDDFLLIVLAGNQVEILSLVRRPMAGEFNLALDAAKGHFLRGWEKETTRREVLSRPQKGMEDQS